jgi:hypothetical protein
LPAIENPKVLAKEKIAILFLLLLALALSIFGGNFK